MNTKTASFIIGIIFLLVGILGFFANPVIGESPDAIFHTDSLHNSIHLGSGVLFILIALAFSPQSSVALKLFGIVYLLLGVVGLIQFGAYGYGRLFGFLHVNGPDNILHLALGLVIISAGTFLRKSR